MNERDKKGEGSFAHRAPLITSLRGPGHRHEAPARPLSPGPHLDRQLPRPEREKYSDNQINVTQFRCET